MKRIFEVGGECPFTTNRKMMRHSISPVLIYIAQDSKAVLLCFDPIFVLLADGISPTIQY